jgi:hypothetical protein
MRLYGAGTPIAAWRHPLQERECLHALGQELSAPPQPIAIGSHVDDLPGGVSPQRENILACLTPLGG